MAEPFDPLPHLDAAGAAKMVDVGEKSATHRVAIAEGFLRLASETVALLADARVAKGDALAVARVAGIMGAKKTSELIPLAHPVPLTHVAVHLTLAPEGVKIEARVETHGPTGVEMEALTAVSLAALTLYDMIKKTDRGAVLEKIQLTHKSGGASGDFNRV